MSIELALYGQEKHNTCALACLRMVLAAYGKHVPESTIEEQARIQPDGTDIGELVRLARHFGLGAELQEITVDELGQLLMGSKVAIAYIDRALFYLSPAQRARHSLRAAKIHVVIPTRVTATSVTYHDPLPPRIMRRSKRLFRAAYEHLGSRSVLCWKPDSA
jgi:hypothetical protein